MPQPGNYAYYFTDLQSDMINMKPPGCIFVNQYPETSTTTAIDNPAPTANDIRLSNQVRPSAGFAIKKGGAKRVTFTQEQKDIMVSFYERQRSSSIRANPAEVIEAMKAADVPPLKESQIKSWWSTYH